MYQVFGSRQSSEPKVWKVIEIVNDLLHCWRGGDGKGRRWRWLRRCPWIHAGPRRAPNVPSPKGTRVCPLPFHLPSRRPNPGPFKHPYVPATGTQRAKMYIIMHWIATYMCPRLHVVCQTNVVTWSWDRKYLNLNCTLTPGSGGQVCDLWLWYHHIRIVQYKLEYKHVTFNCWIYAEWWPIFTLIFKNIQIYECHLKTYFPTSCPASFCLWVKGQNSQAHGPFIK